MSISDSVRNIVVERMPRLAFLMARLRHTHDENEMELLPFFVDRKREAIDVGANIGRYTLPLSRLASHVHAFEPDPRLASVLRAAFPTRATIYEAAASDHNGMTELHIPLIDGRQDQGIASVEPGAFNGEFASVDVETFTLDTLADRDVGFIKIDVEGHELSVLQGAETLLARSHPTVLVEVEERHSPGALERIKSFFEALNYRGYFLFDSVLHPIDEFLPHMQNPLLLKILEQGVPRKVVPYVNNFLFLPDQNALEQRIDRINSRLLTARRH